MIYSCCDLKCCFILLHVINCFTRFILWDMKLYVCERKQNARENRVLITLHTTKVRIFFLNCWAVDSHIICNNFTDVIEEPYTPHDYYPWGWQKAYIAACGIFWNCRLTICLNICLLIQKLSIWRVDSQNSSWCLYSLYC